MAMGLGMRTIWISIRAMNYTDQAFRKSIINVDDLEKEEQKLLRAKMQAVDVARLQIQTGILYGATTAMVAQQLAGLLQETELGASYMEDFNNTVQELKTAFADTLFVALKTLLDALEFFINILKDNPVLLRVITSVTLLGTAFFGLKAVMMVMQGLIAQHNANLALTSYVSQLAAKQNIVLQTSNTGLAVSLTQVGTALNAVLGGFGVAFTILTAINNPIASVIAIIGGLTVALWALFVAESAASAGIALVAGGVAAAGALTLASQMTTESYQGGTRGLPRTGIFFGHKGEIVYNPATDRPTGVGREVMGEGGNVTNNQVNFQVAELHTKSDIDDVNEKVGDTLIRALQHGR